MADIHFNTISSQMLGSYTVAYPNFTTIVSEKCLCPVKPCFLDGPKHAMNSCGYCCPPEGEDECVGTMVDVEIDGPAELGGGGGAATMAVLTLPRLLLLLGFGFNVIVAAYSLCRWPS